MFCGTAFKNKGVQPLLDAVVDYLPSPLDIAAIKGVDLKTGEEQRVGSWMMTPLSMLAFKIMNDQIRRHADICAGFIPVSSKPELHCLTLLKRKKSVLAV